MGRITGRPTLVSVLVLGLPRWQFLELAWVLLKCALGPRRTVRLAGYNDGIMRTTVEVH